MLRQHSQPETSCYHCQIGSATTASTSLRQLKEASTGDAIAGIAADTLRINGAIRQFRQVAFPVGQTWYIILFSSIHNSFVPFYAFFNYFIWFFTSIVSLLIFILDSYSRVLSCDCGSIQLDVFRDSLRYPWILTESFSWLSDGYFYDRLNRSALCVW